MTNKRKYKVGDLILVKHFNEFDSKRVGYKEALVMVLKVESSYRVYNFAIQSERTMGLNDPDWIYELVS